jgi:sulfur relay (sulfurtransferase) DsrC/TusE family protein
MEVRRIFERAKDKLAAVVYDDDEEDELSRLIDLWQNVEYLRDFFIEFQKDLKNHDITTTPSKAAQRTRQEAKEFFKTLLKLSEQDDSNLNELFYPLDNDER